MPDLQGPQTQEQDILAQLAQLQNQQAPGLDQANQDAMQAAQQYSQAAQAPPPNPGFLASLLPLLAGNVASTISQNPSYGQNAQQTVKQRHADLLAARQSNLESLHAVYAQKAKAAEDLGHLDAQEKYRSKIESLNKALETIRATNHETAVTDRTNAQIEASNARQDKSIAAMSANTDKKIAAATAGAAPSTTLPKLYRQAGNGSRWVDLSGYSGKSKDAAREQALNEGALPVEKADSETLKAIGAVRSNNQKMTDIFAKKLAPTPGQRVVYGPTSKVKQILQTDSDMAAFNSWQDSAFKTARALGANGRITQQQMKVILQASPKLTDDYATFKRKFDFINQQLASVEDSIVPPGFGSMNSTQPTTGGKLTYNPATGQVE